MAVDFSGQSWNIDVFYTVFVNFLRTEISDVTVRAQIEEFLYTQHFVKWVLRIEFFSYLSTFAVQPTELAYNAMFRPELEKIQLFQSYFFRKLGLVFNFLEFGSIFICFMILIEFSRAF